MPYDMLLGLAVGLCVLFFWLGVRSASAPVHEEEQINRYLEGGDHFPMPDDVKASHPSQLSLVQRVIVPLWRGSLEALGRLAPQRNVDGLARRLDTAGRPNGLTVLNFLGLKFITAPLFTLAGYLLSARLLHQPTLATGLAALIFTIAGFYFPNLLLELAIKSRQRQIIRALPDALDMIVVSVEAGQGLDQALKRVSFRWHNPLTDEFNRILTELVLGRTRREALMAASERIQLPDMSNLITAILQAEQLGVSIGQVLRTQANQLRIVRRQRAEALAREAAIKLLFPLVFLIFPAMFAVLLGPSIPLIMQTLGRF